MKIVLTALVLGLASVSLATADVLEKIADRGVIKLGVRSDAPPFSYYGANGLPAGLAVALCEKTTDLIAEQLGVGSLGIEYVKVEAGTRFRALANGSTDLHCGPASTTLKRRETLDFSIFYFVDGAAAAVRPGTYETVFDGRSGKFGVLNGTTTQDVVQDLVDRNSMDVEVLYFQDHSAGLHALSKGALDIYFGDQAILLFQIAEQGLTENVSVMEEIFSFEPYALVMKRGETRLRLAVDRALSQIYDEGLIYKMILDELGNYPLPPETRAMYQIVGLPE